MNTPRDRQDWIYARLELNPGLTHGDCFGEYSVNFGKTQRTFDGDWKKAQQRYKEVAALKEKAMRDAVVSNAAEMAQDGLKTRSERLLLLQTQVDSTLADLADGKTEATVIVDGKPVKFDRPHTVQETALLRRTFRELQAEISKIEGDYAPKKLEVDGDFGTVIVLPENNRDNG